MTSFVLLSEKLPRRGPATPRECARLQTRLTATQTRKAPAQAPAWVGRVAPQPRPFRAPRSARLRHARPARLGRARRRLQAARAQRTPAPPTRMPPGLTRNAANINNKQNQQESALRSPSPALPSFDLPAGERQRSCAVLGHLTAPAPHLLPMRAAQIHAACRRCRQPSPRRIEAGRVTAPRDRM